MSGELLRAESESSTIPGLRQLEESFGVFNDLARGLVDAFGRLEGRAAAVESRLGTAHRRLAAQLAEVEGLNLELDGILEAIPTGVVAADEEGVVTRVNAAAASILGAPASELVGRSARSLCGSDGEPLLTFWSQGAGHGEAAERRLCGMDGNIRHLLVSVHALPQGGRMEVMEDRTELCLLREQLNRLDHLASVGEAAAGVAHEIRNPINGVNGFADLLDQALNGGDECSIADLSRYVSRIRQGASEVNLLVSSILSWARPQTRGQEDVDIIQLVQDVVEESFCPASSVTWSRERSDSSKQAVEGERLVVRGDALKLKLALANLVRNGIEAAAEGGKIHVRIEAGASECRIIVDDDGPGIDPEIRPRLFTPFATNKAQGTGLGLAISSKLISLHGGDIVAGQSPLGGARFMVALPIATEGEAR